MVKTKSNRMLGILFASTTALFWGVLAIALKVALQWVDVTAIIWFRFFFSFLALFIYYIITQPSKIKILGSPSWLMWVAAAGLSLNFIGFMEGVERIGPGISQVIIQSGPVLLFIGGVVLLKESISFAKILGLLLVIGGLLFFYQNQLMVMINAKSQFNAGFLYVLGGGLTWAIYALAQKQLVKKYPVQQLNLFIYGFSAIAFLPFVKFSGFVGLPFWVWMVLAFLVINTLVAYGCMGAALKHAETSVVSVIVTLNPIITFLTIELLRYFRVSWFVPETIDPLAYLGALIVLMGAIITIAYKGKKVL